jgi:hypothetical protein
MIGILTYPATTTQMHPKYLTWSWLAEAPWAGTPYKIDHPVRPTKKIQAAGIPRVCFQSEKDVSNNIVTKATT